MNKKALRDRIQEWQFASCPTEEKEPFFWKWTKGGLDLLEIYIKQEIDQSTKEQLESMERKIKKLPKYDFSQNGIDGDTYFKLEDVLQFINNHK